MNGRSRPLGRPLGVISLGALRLASARAVTCVDVARELQLSRGHASDTLFRLRSAGHVQEVDRRLVDGARKPVPVLRAVVPDEPPAVSVGILSLDWPPRA